MLPVPNFDYGLGLIPNCNCREIYKQENQIVWDVEYTIDSFSRRVTPDSINKIKNEFIIFYGGSRVFGTGVNDDETLPNHFQKLISNFTVYNYGIPGAGPNIFLKKHQNQVFQNEIRHKKGLFLYVYDISQTSRILGASKDTWSYTTPYYDLDENDELAYLGNFWSGRFLQSVFYYFGEKTAIYQNTYTNSSLFPKKNLNAKEIKIIKQIFLKMKIESEKINGSKFAVVFFAVPKNPIINMVWNLLLESGIEVLVIDQSLSPIYNSDHYFKFDPRHPTSIGYNLQAQLLLKELIKRKLVTK